MAARGSPLARGAKLRTGAVVSIQRFGSRLNLHVHLHVVMPDAVWQSRAHGTLSAIDLPAPTDDDVEAIAHRMCRKMTRALAVWQIDRGDHDAPPEASELTSLVLADLPRSPPRIDDMPSENRARLAAWCDGYSLECRPNAAPHDRRGLARLLRYGTRPAFAHDRLRWEDGRVVYELPKPFWTGQTHVVLGPIEFLRRLAALIPPPRFHTLRYHGLFAAAAKDRQAACALAPPVDDDHAGGSPFSSYYRSG